MHRKRRSLDGRGVGLGLMALALMFQSCRPAPAKTVHYPMHPQVVASVFSPLEGPSADNANISNTQSAWDVHWREHSPLENPYFVALPYGDYLDNGMFNPDNKRIPWHRADVKGSSELKNRWVYLERKDVSGQTHVSYAQWEDVGPSGQQSNRLLSDPDYVFGPTGHDPAKPITVEPKNTFGLRAGIDLSPSVAKLLGIDGTAEVAWRFVDAKEVPPGPWRKTITASAPSWGG